jgi:hypothetical protein
MTIRASRLKLMKMIVRCGHIGYYVRGQQSTFQWLVDKGLAVAVDPMLKHVLTDKGKETLSEHGVCVRCGDHGSYFTGDCIVPWTSCDHGRSE